MRVMSNNSQLVDVTTMSLTLSETQIKGITGVDCSPLSIRRINVGTP